jgi:hypothetical protein
MAQTLTRYTAQRYLQSWCVLRAAMMFQGVRKLGICGLRLHEAHQGPFRKTLQLQMSAGRSRSNASATSAFANRIPASYGPQLAMEVQTTSQITGHMDATRQASEHVQCGCLR